MNFSTPILYLERPCSDKRPFRYFQQLDCSQARFLSQVKRNMIFSKTQPSHHSISRRDLASFPMVEGTLARALEGDPMTPYSFPSDTDI